jgi:hypothetical protein
MSRPERWVFNRISIAGSRTAKNDSQLVIIDFVIPETRENTFGKWSDLNMLVCTGGRERTAAEWSELLAAAALELEQIVPTQTPLNMLIGRPRG